MDQEAERLEVLEAAEDPTSAMAQSLGIRESARVAQIRADMDGRVRSAVLRQHVDERPLPSSAATSTSAEPRLHREQQGRFDGMDQPELLGFRSSPQLKEVSHTPVGFAVGQTWS